MFILINNLTIFSFFYEVELNLGFIRFMKKIFFLERKQNVRMKMQFPK